MQTTYEMSGQFIRAKRAGFTYYARVDFDENHPETATVEAILKAADVALEELDYEMREDAKDKAR